ncbi:MAG: TIGR02453 family protein [Amylibacter sp.]
MVEPETFAFLADLALNNRQAWMNEHRDERDDAMRNFTGIAMTLHDYADRYDPVFAETQIKPKQCYTKFFQEPRDRVGRALYRTGIDVFANAGRPLENFGYYLHIEPGNCHAGAGLFQPSKAALVRMRACLLDDHKDLSDILTDPEFKETFPEGLITRKALSAVPDGFDSNDPAAPYLKMLGFGCRKDLPDALLLDDKVIDLLVEIFRPARQMVRHFE